MATAHVYVRAQVVGDAAAMKKIEALAKSLNEAIVAAGGTAGTVSIVDDPEEVVTTPAAANTAAERQRATGRK